MISFRVIEPGKKYELPIYKLVEDNKGITHTGDFYTIDFIKSEHQGTEPVFITTATKKVVDKEDGSKVRMWKDVDGNTYEISTDGKVKHEDIQFALGKLIDDKVYLVIDENEGISDQIFLPRELAIEDAGTYLIPFINKEVTIPASEGIIIESLIEMLIADLHIKNSISPSKEMSLAIIKVQEAKMWINEGSRKRFNDDERSN